ncbi:CAP domain-containing protein [Halorubrum sp. CSM-61]|uniref:CAP domain-containing protein n=1 Tax=Halorubrum sp. CSM-61 TaxID=2485838 RepID=UPI000F4D13FD
MECDHCGRELKALEYTCSRCNGTFCTKCRLPESHDCVALEVEKAERRLKREEGDVGPWFKDDFRLSNVDASDSTKRTRKHPADEKPKSTAECQTCGTPLRDHEIAGCPYCGEVYCGEHIGAHRSECFDPPTAGAPTDQQENDVDTAGSPDVAPDGSIIRDSSDKNQMSKDENSESSGFSNAFWLVVGVLMWLASSVTGFVKRVFTYPADSVWKATKLALIIGVALLLAGQIGVGPVGSSPGEIVSPLADTALNATEPGQLDEQKVERLVREDINERRAERELSRLSSSVSLQEQARLHSVDMVEHDELAHDLPGSTTDERLAMANCNFGGENVAQSWYQKRVETSEGEVYIGDEETLAEELVTQWMNSPGHRENLLRQEWSQTGIGIELTEDDKVYATQKFCA